MSKLVLGGGLSGLSAAYYLSKIPNQKIVLLEATKRLGGWIQSDIQTDGIIFEAGPRTIRPNGPQALNTLDLIDDLGLEGEIQPIYNSSAAARNRMIYVNGELCLLPNSFVSFFKTLKPFSKSLARQLITDFTTKPKIVKDESVYEFTERRFGKEIADYLISSMICGMCGGNAKEISVNFLMKSLAQYEKQYGNVATGFYKHIIAKKKEPLTNKLALRSKRERWNVYSFLHGMDTLPKRLEEVLEDNKNVEIKTETPCKSLEFSETKTTLHLENSKLEAEHVISSLPSQILADLVQNQHPELSEMLNKIKNVTIAVVNIQYPGKLIKDEGFGFLVPPNQNLPILGVIYDSCCYYCGDNTVLTVMMGGYWFKKHFGENPTEQQILDIAVDHIKSILKISEQPTNYKVNILKDCIPQYVIGHQENIENIEWYLKNKKLPLSLCGASYYGVGVNDVILSAKNAVQKLYTPI